MTQLKKIIILGDSGFIGSHLKIFLTKQALDLEIIGLSSQDVDLTDAQQVSQLSQIFDHNCAIIMCSMLKKELGDDLQVYIRNMQMIYNLAQLLENKKIAKFIYFSSAAVYGEDIENLSIDEETAINPRTYYGMAKFSSECILSKIFESEPQKLLILRPPAIYGPGDRTKSYGPAGFIDKILNQEVITLWGDGREKREFIYIDDVSELVTKLLLINYSGVINIASGCSSSFQQIIDYIANLTDQEPRLTNRPRSKEKVDHGFSSKLIQQIMPDFIFTTLKDGVASTLTAEQSRMLSK